MTVLYNPSSRRRADYLSKACNILLETRSADTVCGWVRNIGREGQEHKIMTLGQLKDEQVDMFTTVFIGNSDTICTDSFMVTGRGYTKLQDEGGQPSYFAGTGEYKGEDILRH